MCPHLKIVSKHVAECKILQELGLERMPGPGRSGFPCDNCEAQWKGGVPPTKDEITMPMAKLLAYGKKMPLPTIVEQIRTLGSEGMKWVAAGLPKTTDVEYQERLTVCKENKCGQYDSTTTRCAACGCFTEEKAVMATTDCPAGLWKKLPMIDRAMTKGCGGCGS